jgi:glycerophosphoryl diester phosphodiesterase
MWLRRSPSNWSVDVPAPLSALWAAPSSRPLLLGHRGARHAAPENTFAAFDLALDEGAEGIELDVRLNASGEVMVCHDVTLERVTEGRDRRSLHELSSSECSAVRLAQGERLPRLRDVIDWAERRQACVNIELKMDGHRRWPLVHAVALMTRDRALPGHLLVSSFNPLAVVAHRALAPRVPTAWLVENRLMAALPPLTSTGSVALHPKESLVSATTISSWKRCGHRVHVWTVNDPVRAQALAALGVDCLITDNPGLLKSAFGPAARVAHGDPRRGCLAK